MPGDGPDALVMAPCGPDTRISILLSSKVAIDRGSVKKKPESGIGRGGIQFARGFAFRANTVNYAVSPNPTWNMGFKCFFPGLRQY